MKIWLNARPTGSLLVAGSFLLSFAMPLGAQDPAPEKARVLLDQVKKSEYDRQIASKQTEIERLKEDRDKVQADSSKLQQTIESTSELINEGYLDLEKLNLENKRLEHELAVTEAQGSAQRAKIEGLRALETAQGKSLTALTRRMEEVEIRGQVRAAEMDLLQSGKPVPSFGNEEKSHTELAKRRQALATAEGKAQSEERAARLAFNAAAEKMAVAESRAASAKRLAETDPHAQPTPIAEQKKAPATEKAAAPAPSATPAPRVRTALATAAKPASSKPAATTPKAPAATPKPARTSGAAKPPAAPSVQP